MEKYDISQLMFMFFLFCNIGWLQESTIESVYHKRVINRGFLHGPYIPIYGFGGMTILLICMPFRENGFLVYFVGLVSCTILEYFVGWLMETMFHKQFWDYSMMKFTYKNRISLISSLFWGLLSLFMVYILHGIVDAVVMSIPAVILAVYDGIMLIAVCIDTIVSVSRETAFMEKIKKLPYDKAKKAMVNRFIRLGGAVMKRRQRFNELFDRIKLNVDDYDIDDDISSGDNGETEEELNEG